MPLLLLLTGAGIQAAVVIRNRGNISFGMATLDFAPVDVTLHPREITFAPVDLTFSPTELPREVP